MVRPKTVQRAADRRLSQSIHFGGFSDPIAILSTDKHDPPKSQFYNSAAIKLSDGPYFMFPSVLLSNGILSVYAAFSRDGKQFRLLGHMPLLQPGKGFDNKGLYVGPGAIPGDKPETYWFYYLGVSVPHNANNPTKVRNEGGIGRFMVRIAH